MPIETLTIDRVALERALLAWEYEARRGDTLTAEQARAKARAKARESAAHLWTLLQRT